MGRQIVSFGSEGRTFNFRAAAVILDTSAAPSRSTRVLLHHADFEDFWSLPGGRVEMLEAAREGLRREMLEELGEEVEIGRLVWVAENFFQFRSLDFHELGMYFEVTLANGSQLSGREDEWWAEEDNGVKICFRWFDLDETPDLPILPAFLRQGLTTMPETPEHVVYRDPTRWGSGRLSG
jgi:ADP-ribose pyrophosphatase YjhB (NUDIX family)